jgi:hypothetical protein
MKRQFLFFGSLLAVFVMSTVVSSFLTSCEGPRGLAGEDGQDANETCKTCHNPTVVDQKAAEFDFSKHKFGEAAFEEAGSVACAPCHESEGFKYVCVNNTPATFTLSGGKYANDYQSSASTAFGELSCFTCHSSLHTTYEGTDFFPLTTTASVSMTMWAGAKSINLAQDNGISNLCVKCHQPRPLTANSTWSDGNVVDYASLVNNPTTLFYDNTVGQTAPNTVQPSFRMHVHYGTVGAIFAGEGGVEFTGSLSYDNSAHTSVASCQDCHMAEVSGRAGGHTFKVRATTGALGSTTAWNFNGCNATGCHTSAIDKSNTTYWTNPRTDIKTLLGTLAGKINAVGGATPILHKESDAEVNLWAGLTSGNYDGYLDIYDPTSNFNAAWENPAPSNSWTQAQKDANAALPTFPSLENVVMGAMINFQFCLREFSLGIHNYKYTKALLQNSIEAMTAAGY